MIIRSGITSFFNRDDRNAFPTFEFAEFKRVVLPLAASLGTPVSGLTESGITPNFHYGIIDTGDRSIAVLGHSTYPIIAFAEPVEAHVHHLRFIDCEPIAQHLQRLFPTVAIATAGELARPLTSSDLAQLSTAELEQVKYWKPTTVGELAFNWWD